MHFCHPVTRVEFREFVMANQMLTLNAEPIRLTGSGTGF